MLKKSSELLKCFIEYEKQVLADTPMFHMPTLGDGYEAITRDGLAEDYAIPQHLNLNVVSGFITIGKVMIKKQIDCMLVCGEGFQYGRTEKYIYDIEQVLCIFEVKKTLTKADMSDATDHLAVIRREFSEHFENKLVNEQYVPEITSARKHFSQITGREAPEHYYYINDIPEEDGLLFYSLVQEMIAPITIIHGYDGYKTEYGLRTAFIDLLEEEFKSGKRGYGVQSIPSLITSNEYCIIKSSGIPFVLVNGKSDWVVCGSSRHNSIELILELVWSKISNYFKIEMPWDDGLYMNNLAPMLIAIPRATPEASGWEYQTIELSEKNLIRDDNREWSPIPITSVQVSIINLMAAYGGEFEVSDENLNYFQSKYGVDLNEEILRLIRTQYFMSGNGVIKPINPQTLILSIDDGSSYISADEDRLDSWCEKNGHRKSYTRLVIINN